MAAASALNERFLLMLGLSWNGSISKLVGL